MAGITLGKYSSSGYTAGYKNSQITELGEIQGKVPQYIKPDGNTEFLPVVEMKSTFIGCTRLTIAPEIPSTVYNMDSTFSHCTGLTIAPKIPSGVINMYYTFCNCNSLKTAPEIPARVDNLSYTFYGCLNLQGTIKINANPGKYAICFGNGAATKGTGLIVTGESTMLDELIATGDSSKISKGQ